MAFEFIRGSHQCYHGDHHNLPFKVKANTHSYLPIKCIIPKWGHSYQITFLSHQQVQVWKESPQAYSYSKHWMNLF